jgi:hypothetical protein
MESCKFSTCESIRLHCDWLCTKSPHRPLNPNTTNARPAIAVPPIPPKSALTGGVKASIGVAICVVVVAFVGFLFLMRSREQKRLQQRHRRQQQQPQHYHQPPPSHIHEKEVEQHSVWELDGRHLSGSVRPSPADSRRATRPFFKTTSIHL